MYVLISYGMMIFLDLQFAWFNKERYFNLIDERIADKIIIDIILI